MIRLFKNLFILLIGVGLGIWVMRKLNEIARSYSPSGIAGRAQNNWEQFREGMVAFGQDVMVRADQREIELRAALAGQDPVPLPRPGRHRAPGQAARSAEDPLPGTDVNARPTNRHGD